MSETIDRTEVTRLVRERHAQLVEVLPRQSYDWAHLPGAYHLPLADLTAETAAGLQPELPVVVYCHDLECDLSPRAAARLQRLGFPQVYDYAAGKRDWLAYGLPYEGSAALASQVLRDDVATCDLDTPIAETAIVIDGAELCVVVDEDQVVQGVLTRQAAAPRDTRQAAEQAMTVGLTTVRPSEELAALTERMGRAGADSLLVTSPDGRLVGRVARGDAQTAAEVLTSVPR